MKKHHPYNDPPSQDHSDTSVAAGESISKYRLRGQEKWIYEKLKQAEVADPPGMSDWQLWEATALFPGLFDKLSSEHRARIGLVWVNRKIGATIWHPVAKSGAENKDPQSGKSTTIWRLKEAYRDMSYDDWALNFRNLARGGPGR